MHVCVASARPMDKGGAKRNIQYRGDPTTRDYSSNDSSDLCLGYEDLKNGLMSRNNPHLVFVFFKPHLTFGLRPFLTFVCE